MPTVRARHAHGLSLSADLLNAIVIRLVYHLIARKRCRLARRSVASPDLTVSRSGTVGRVVEYDEAADFEMLIYVFKISTRLLVGVIPVNVGKRNRTAKSYRTTKQVNLLRAGIPVVNEHTGGRRDVMR